MKFKIRLKKIKKNIIFQISPEDGLPLLICIDCLQQLNHFELFRKKCYTSQEILKEIRTKQEEPDFLDEYLVN